MSKIQFAVPKAHSLDAAYERDAIIRGLITVPVFDENKLYTIVEEPSDFSEARRRTLLNLVEAFISSLDLQQATKLMMADEHEYKSFQPLADAFVADTEAELIAAPEKVLSKAWGILKFRDCIGL